MDLDSEDDERKGLPSASGIEQMQLCPGSWTYQQMIDPLESDEANEGTARHDIIENVIRGKVSIDTLEGEHYTCAVRALELLNLIEREIEVGWAELDNQHQWLEERVWVHDGSNKLYSAKYDLLRDYGNGTLLLVDWKTLYGEHTPATDNVQLLAQALAVYRNHPTEIKRIWCALAEPFPNPSYSLVEYLPERLEKSYDFIRTIITKATKKDASRIPGVKQCKYCDALAVCPEARFIISQAFKFSPLELSADLISEVMNIAVVAEKWAKSVKDRTRELLNNGTEVSGWKLTGSGTTKSISDTNKCAEAIMDTNQMDWAKFLGACTTQWSKLVTIWMDARFSQSGAKLTKKEAMSELENILQDTLQEKPRANSLRKA